MIMITSEKIFFFLKKKLCSLILNPLDIKGRNWVRKRQKKKKLSPNQLELGYEIKITQ